MGEQMFNMSKVAGQPSVVSDDLVQSAEQNICERQCFTTSELSCEFPSILCTLLYKVITVKLGYHHKFHARWVPKILTGAHKMQRMASDFILLERYHKDGNEFLNHTV
jgi:hypothetical protein